MGKKVYVDLTHPFSAEIPRWPYFDKPEITNAHTMAKGGVLTSKITCTMHTGTHCDAPRHVMEYEFDGRRARYTHEMPIDAYTGEAVVLKLDVEPWTLITDKHLDEACKKCGIEHIAIEEFPGTMVWSASTLLKLREATDPMLGINPDPSHMMVLGADPIAAARALKGCIFHVHGKDARIERGLADTDGLLEPRPVTESADRVWNYVAVGCGKDLQWWKEFFSVCHMMGYDGDVSLEMEDLTMTVDAGVHTSIDALRQTISQ